MSTTSPNLPLGHKVYDHILHLPGSRMGPGDHRLPPDLARIATTEARPGDRIIVQEKLDGSCVAVARVDGQLVPLLRSGNPAVSSRYEQHRYFVAWVYANLARFEFLQEGQRLCGEWLAQAHGTRYALTHDPFVVFDLMVATTRTPWDAFRAAIAKRFVIPTMLHDGDVCPVERAMALLGPHGHHGAIDPAEGAVWRIERAGQVDFVTKFVRPEKIDGKYLPTSGTDTPVWNWRPK